MTTQAMILLVLLLAVLTILAYPLGKYLAYIAIPDNNVKGLSYIESCIYKVSAVQNHQQMNWKQYALSVMLFNILGIIVLVILQLLQSYLSLNPNNAEMLRLDLAINTAVSFVTNTNWQAYSGETGVSYLVQMLGLTVQYFLSAATGIAIAIVFAVIRGLSSYNQTAHSLGNFWVDITRITLYVLLPLSIIVSLIFVSQGVIQNFSAPLEVKTLDGGSQILAMGYLHNTFIFGDVQIDFSTHQILKGGQEVHLTPTEYKLLSELIKNVGRVCTQRQLLLAVWGPNYVEQPHYLRIYMGHLRQKLESEPTNPAHLLTETAIGYRLIQ
ncbi:potassium-transporting ATPase subunit KdpA [Orbus mooreae]|uniref:potassium-transporting ATPase subunit KdpA n=1 Tax=Orbus mooreae TaxID=3074107 RepID=UPI00370DB8C3